MLKAVMAVWVKRVRARGKDQDEAGMEQTTKGSDSEPDGQLDLCGGKAVVIDI
jgi:hypothetical protein